jgi:hypothetical protein
MGTKIRDLTATTSVGANDFFVVAKSDNTTKKISGTNLTSSLGGGGEAKFFIYTASLGNGFGLSYQSYVDRSPGKQAVSSGVSYYILPNLLNIAGSLGTAVGTAPMILVTTPSNMAAVVQPNITAQGANAKTFGAFIYQGHIYCFSTTRHGSIATSPIPLLQI